MLFFSEYGQLIYSDGTNCIELFDNSSFLNACKRKGITVRTAEELSKHRSKFTKAKQDSGEMNTPNGVPARLHNEDDDCDEFAAIEPAGVDKNGKSMATHNVRPDKSKSSGRIFGMNGKQFVHSNDCDDEFADIDGNECKSGRVRSSDRSCRGSVLKRGR